ncbi:hypothetical protein LCGC14_2132170, partial [marine sediment metagenome]
MAANVTLKSNALIEANDIWAYLGDKDAGDQPRINAAINRVSAQFEEYCNRKFKARKIWNEIFRSDDEISTIHLDVYPLQKNPTINTGFDIELATGTADSGTTSTLVDAVRTEADDYWNGAKLSVELSA